VLLPLHNDQVGVYVLPREERPLLVLDERLIIILALIVPLDGLLAHLAPVDVDLELLDELSYPLLCVAHHVLAFRQDILTVLPVIFKYLINDSLVLRVEALKEGVPFLLPLDEGLSLIEEVNVLHIEFVELIQIVVEYYVEVLLDFLSGKVIDVIVTVDEASHIIEEILFFFIQLRHMLAVLEFFKLILHIMRRLMREGGLRARGVQCLHTVLLL
jgi:hypothetical protein